MSSAQPDELYIAPRSQRPVGLGGAVLRALLVMAALDAALLFVAIDADPPAVSAGAHELQAAPARPEASPPLETATPSDERAPSPGSAEKSAHEKPAAPPVSKPPSGGESRGPATQGVLAQDPLVAEPTRLAPPPTPIPATATLPSEPPDAARTRDPAVPAAKPSPPRLTPKPAARQGASRTERRPDVASPPREIVSTAGPRAVEIAERRPEPPSCRPYTAHTTLAGDRVPVRGIACPEPDGGWRIVTERVERD
jgi:hypothetical protein